MNRRNRRAAGAVATILVGLMAAAAAADVPAWMLKQDWYPKAPPLPEAKGQVVRVSTPAELVEAVKAAKDDQTILIADGQYRMPSGLQIRDVDRVTLRGASNDPSKVVLDFADAGMASAVAFWHTVGSRIAHVTVANRPQNGLKLDSNTGTSHITIYNVIIHNVWQRPIKGVRVPDKDGKPQWIEGCKVQYCLIYNDRPKRKGDDKGFDDGGGTTGFNYIAGMDIMGAAEWVISDNVFVNIHGGTGSARGAIFMWNGCRDVTIERNIIIDCDSGICLGDSSSRAERRHCERFLVRNNFITRCPEKNLPHPEQHRLRPRQPPAAADENPVRQRRPARGRQHLRRQEDPAGERRGPDPCREQPGQRGPGRLLRRPGARQPASDREGRQGHRPRHGPQGRAERHRQPAPRREARPGGG
jgi:hypothetical protein